MTRIALALLAALFLTGCFRTEEDVDAERVAREAARAEAEPTEGAPLTYEDSAAVVRAQIDSMRRALSETQAEIDAGFRETDSLRDAIDKLDRDVEATQRRVEAAGAE